MAFEKLPTLKGTKANPRKWPKDFQDQVQTLADEKLFVQQIFCKFWDFGLEQVFEAGAEFWLSLDKENRKFEWKIKTTSSEAKELLTSNPKIKAAVTHKGITSGTPRADADAAAELRATYADMLKPIDELIAEAKKAKDEKAEKELTRQKEKVKEAAKEQELDTKSVAIEVKKVVKRVKEEMARRLEEEEAAAIAAGAKPRGDDSSGYSEQMYNQIGKNLAEVVKLGDKAKRNADEVVKLAGDDWPELDAATGYTDLMADTDKLISDAAVYGKRHASLDKCGLEAAKYNHLKDEIAKAMSNATKYQKRWDAILKDAKENGWKLKVVDKNGKLVDMKHSLTANSTMQGLLKKIVQDKGHGTHGKVEMKNGGDCDHWTAGQSLRIFGKYKGNKLEFWGTGPHDDEDTYSVDLYPSGKTQAECK